MLDNPAAATGGGVGGAELDCVFVPDGPVAGQNVATGALFAPGATVTVDNFRWPDYFYYDINQPSGSPAVTVGGTFATLTIRAVAAGSTALQCDAHISAASGSYTQLPFTALTIAVQP